MKALQRSLRDALEVPEKSERCGGGALEEPWRCLRGAIEAPWNGLVPTEAPRRCLRGLGGAFIGALRGASEALQRSLKGLIGALEEP